MSATGHMEQYRDRCVRRGSKLLLLGAVSLYCASACAQTAGDAAKGNPNVQQQSENADIARLKELAATKKVLTPDEVKLVRTIVYKKENVGLVKQMLEPLDQMLTTAENDAEVAGNLVVYYTYAEGLKDYVDSRIASQVEQQQTSVRKVLDSVIERASRVRSQKRDLERRLAAAKTANDALVKAAADATTAKEAAKTKMEAAKTADTANSTAETKQALVDAQKAFDEALAASDKAAKAVAEDKAYAGLEDQIKRADAELAQLDKDQIAAQKKLEDLLRGVSNDAVPDNAPKTPLNSTTPDGSGIAVVLKNTSLAAAGETYTVYVRAKGGSSFKLAPSEEKNVTLPSAEFEFFTGQAWSPLTAESNARFEFTVNGGSWSASKTAAPASEGESKKNGDGETKKDGEDKTPEDKTAETNANSANQGETKTGTEKTGDGAALNRRPTGSNVAARLDDFVGRLFLMTAQPMGAAILFVADDREQGTSDDAPSATPVLLAQAPVDTKSAANPMQTGSATNQSIVDPTPGSTTTEPESATNPETKGPGVQPRFAIDKPDTGPQVLPGQLDTNAEVEKFLKAPAGLSKKEVFFWDNLRHRPGDASGNLGENLTSASRLAEFSYKSLRNPVLELDREFELRRCLTLIQLSYNLISEIERDPAIHAEKEDERDINRQNEFYHSVLNSLVKLDKITKDLGGMGLSEDGDGRLAALERRVSYLESNLTEIAQVYTPWRAGRNGDYYVATYRYRAAGSNCFRCQCCIWFADDPDYVYYFSERQCCYWGRYDLRAYNPRYAFQWLPDESREPVRFGIVPVSTNFGFGDEMPTVPGSKFEGQRILPPPAPPPLAEKAMDDYDSVPLPPAPAPMAMN